MIHLQRTVPDWSGSLHKLPYDSIVKAVDEASVFQEVKEKNPQIETCLRHHYDPGQIFGGSFEDNIARARAFFSTFIDGTFKEKYAKYTDYVEGWNEYLANSQTEQERLERIQWAKAAAWVWHYDYRSQPEYSHIRLVLCNAAIGNWIDRRFAVIAKEYNCLIGYHPYDYWKNNTRGDDGFIAATSMLWDTMEFDWGIDVDWIFTECGPFEAAETGWRSDICLGGNRDLYVSAMKTWIQDVQQTPAYKEGRIKGFVFFTTGRTDDKWRGFWTEQPEIDMLSDMIAIEWKPGTEPPQPPTTECIETEQYTKYHLLRPNVLDALQWDHLKKLMTSGINIFGVGHVVIGYEGWSHLDAIGSIRNAIEAGYKKSRLIILDGNKIGTGLNYQWMEENCPLLTPYTVWIETPYQETWTYPVYAKSMGLLPEWARFRAPRDYDDDGVMESQHEGIDLPCVLGDIIVAMRPGIVIWASDKKRNGEESKYGKHVIIQHDNGYISWSCHLNNMAVNEFDVVEQGQTIGYAGTTGYSTGVHLHLTLQNPGNGYSGFVVPDVIDPEPLLLQ